MILNRTTWETKDIKPFLEYLEEFKQTNKIAWSKNLLNTQMEVLSIPTKTLFSIVNEIYQGNYLSFLDLDIFSHYESTTIYGKILSRIDDFQLMTKYLKVYMNHMDCWAHTDILSFRINEANRLDFIKLAKSLISSNESFKRRLGLFIWLQMIKDHRTLELIYESIHKLQVEDDYYVIMMAGWVLSESIIKYPNEVLLWIQSNPTLNAKIVNKAIQKCRESRRLTQTQKDTLLVYKRKVVKHKEKQDSLVHHK